MTGWGRAGDWASSLNEVPSQQIQESLRDIQQDRHHYLQDQAEQQQRPDFVYQQLQEEAEQVEGRGQLQGGGAGNSNDEQHQDESHD